MNQSFKILLITLLLISPIFCASEQQPESYCFLSLSSMHLYGVILNSSAIFELENNNHSQSFGNCNYIQPNFSNTSHFALCSNEKSVQILFETHNESEINSHLDWIYSKKLILANLSQFSAAQIKNLNSSECVYLPISYNPVPMLTTTRVILPEERADATAAGGSYETGLQKAAADNSLQAPNALEPTLRTNLTIEDFVVTAGMAFVAILFLAVMAFYFRPKAPTQTSVEHISLGETQVEILNQLIDADRIPTDIATRVGKSKSTIVEHLDSLCELGLVQKISSPGKKFVFYTLTPRGKTLLLQSRQAA
ncbi:MAG: ArsR family transcriptional regulator [Candidatus Micrarchaeia archaeon]